MTARPQVELAELPVKRYRPQVVKDGNCRHGFGVRMVTSEKASDSDWRGEDSRQWVEYSDYAALAARLAESEARAVACKPAPNWCRTCGRHWSDDESVFCSDPIHKQFSHAPHAAAPAPRPTITINATTPPTPVDVRAFERVLCECVVKHQFSDEPRRGRLTLDVETFLHEWNERKADLDGQQAGVDVRAKYDELLYAVGNKYPGESRHETALRYIRQAESNVCGPTQADTAPSVAEGGVIRCDYCGGEAKLVTGRAIYPHRPDLFAKHFYQCDPCGAYVGCHPGTTNALGRLANADLRAAKSSAHAAFDPLWREGSMTRKQAYAWLADQLGTQRTECHIGMFDLQTCQRVVEICATPQPRRT